MVSLSFMKSLPLFIAFRYLKSRRTGFLSFVSSVGFIGIALGVTVLILVSSVMNGFEKELRERILQAIPHASIVGNIQIEEIESIKSVLEQNLEIIASAPYIETQGLLSSSTGLKGIYLFGISSKQEKKISLVGESIVDGYWESLDEEEYGIIIGDILSFQLGLSVGDMVNVLVPDTSLSLAGILPRTKRFKIMGIFSLGSPEMDQSYAYINIKSAQKLLRMKGTVHGVRIRYQDLFKARTLINLDRNRVNKELNKNFLSNNWTNQYGTLFKAINMEKFLVSLLLSLVILIAVFNVVSLSVMTISEKKSQIAILMTVGASKLFVQKIFIYFGLLIGITGTVIGLILGLTLSYFLGSIVDFLESLFGIRFLEVYFINYFPVDIRPTWVGSICLISILLTLLTSFYPARLASKTLPAEVLRYE